MLDIAVWASSVPDKNRKNGRREVVLHKFYEKESSSPKVLEYGRAMELRCKITTLSQETIRRIKDIIESGIKGYY